MMATVFMVIAVVAALGALYARSHVANSKKDPYMRYWLKIVDGGRRHDVPSANIQLVADDSGEVQAYLMSNPQLHEYFRTGPPSYTLQRKNRYKVLLAINGDTRTIYSQPFVNNDAGMLMNLEGRKTVGIYIAPTGEVHFLL